MGTTVRVCSVDGCASTYQVRRGLCNAHYLEAWRNGQLSEHPLAKRWVNPLVCVCETPDADPARNFGECSICRRKPLALMAARS